MTECFDTDVPPVDWTSVNKALPTTQDPEARQKRKELFKSLDDNNSKSLTLKEVQGGVEEALGYHIKATSMIPVIKELTPAINSAFKMAKDLGSQTKLSDKTESSSKIDMGKPKSKPKLIGVGSKKAKIAGSVDKKEFHGFLVAFKFYLEVAQIFEEIDNGNEDDQTLSLREVKKHAHKLLAFDIDDAKMAEKFKGVEAWTPKMKFLEFADWLLSSRCDALELELDDSDDEEVQYEAAASAMKKKAVPLSKMGKKSEVNQVQVQQIFKDWDTDGSGGISEDEMMSVMMELDPSFTEKQVKDLFSRADANQDGMIDIEEFFTFLFSPPKDAGATKTR